MIVIALLFAVGFLFVHAIRTHAIVLDYKYEAVYERHRAKELEASVRELRLATRELKTEVEMLKSGAPYR